MIKRFNIQKIVQSFSVLQEEVKTTNYTKLLKLLFFADRYHIRHYGYLYTCDDYYALQRGPIGTQSKDILVKDSFYYDNIPNESKSYLDNSIEILDICNRQIHESKRVFSKSEEKALEFSISIFGKFDYKNLINLTHDYPEWKRYKKLFDNKLTTQENVVPEDYFKNIDIEDSPMVKLYLENDPYKEDEEFLNLLKEDCLFSSHSLCYK